jgi:hypothetical protein
MLSFKTKPFITFVLETHDITHATLSSGEYIQQQRGYDMKQPSVVGDETACWAHAYCLARPSNPIHGAVSRSVLCS